MVFAYYKQIETEPDISNGLWDLTGWAENVIVFIPSIYLEPGNIELLFVRRRNQ